MNQTETLAYQYLTEWEGYDEEDIVRAGPHQSPDFICPDDGYEVKRKNGNKLIFTENQIEKFGDGDPMILVMSESRGPEPVERFRWSEREDARHVCHVPQTKEERIRINCAPETKEEWAAHAATYEGGEEALLALLDDVETGRSDRPF